MNKLKMQTPDITSDNIEKIAALFPSVVTEMRGEDGKIKKGINFEMLKQLLSPDVVDGDERYEFTWVGKKAASAEAARPITKTLRPVKEDSRDWDTTQNLYIEGDNLEALKILQESYLGKVKMIYIDPPYNTGNDFIYADDFMRSQNEENEQIGMYDEERNHLFKNTDTNGHFHSDWCSMIYSRLILARNLLARDGIMFISINDIEVENLRKMCEEIFGDDNFVADLIWANKEGGGSSDSKLFRIKHEHILCFAENIDNITISGVSVGNEDRYKSSDKYIVTRGKYYLQKLGMGTIQYSPSLDYPIEAPDGTMIMPSDNNGGRKACWRWSQSKYNWGVENGFIEIKKDSSGIWTVYSKQYLNCDNEGNIITRTQRPMGIIDGFSSTQAAKLLSNMGMGSVFSYAKPIELIHYLCERVLNNDGLVLDFFSGSATTAHAVMQLNAEDGGHRKFIMVQLPEPCDEKSEAYKAGYKNICEIGKERIRRAGDKIKEENPLGTQNLDIGFRVFRVDESNMKDVYYHPEEMTQMKLGETVSNIKEDRTDLDLLYSCLLDWGVEIHLPHTSAQVAGCTVHDVDGGALVACFDSNIPTEVVEYMAKLHPLRAVFRDSAFATDADKINVTEIFKNLSPDTIVKVI